MRLILKLFIITILALFTMPVLSCSSGGDSDDDSADDAVDDDQADDASDDSAGDDSADDAADDATDDASDDADDDTDDDASDDSADDDVQPYTWGGVYFSEGYSSSNYTALSYYCAASASFYDPDDLTGWGDPDDEAGDCKLYIWNGGAATTTYLSAGQVTVTGTNAGTIHLDPVSYANGYYYQADVNFTSISDLFDPGDNLGAHVAGGGGIEERNLSISAPAMMSVTQPSNFDSLSAMPSGDVTFRWNASDSDGVSLQISTFNGTNGVIIQCSAPDSQGEITVDQDLGNQLLDTYTSLSFYLTRSNFDWGKDGKPLLISAATYRQRTYIITK